MKLLPRGSQVGRYERERLDRMREAMWPRAQGRHPRPNRDLQFKTHKVGPECVNGRVWIGAGEPGNGLPGRDR